MPTIAEKMGAYAANLKYEDLPANVVHQCKRTIMDTLACAFGGFDAEPSVMARRMASIIGSKQPATILCSGETTSAELAAFANDVMIRYLDFNDGYIAKGGGHPSDSISALLAAAEISHRGGRELILATALTYEAYGVLSDAWFCKLLGVDHVTHGAIGSAVGVAKLLGLTQHQIIETVNLTTVANIALNQTRVGNLSQWKACAYANANRNAIFAAQLAQNGMTGPTPIFEGRNGFFKVVSREPFDIGPFGGQGHEFRILKSHLKQFPICNGGQTVIPAALQLRERIRSVDDIAEIHIQVSQNAFNVMADAPDKWQPQNRETADHSIPFTAAVALIYGTIDESYFEDKYLNNKEILDLVGRIKVSVSKEAQDRVEEINLCDMDYTLRSGERKTIRVEYHKGHYMNPMSDSDIENKVHLLVADMLPRPRVDALIDQLWNLDSLAQVGTLIQMTKTSQPTTKKAA